MSSIKAFLPPLRGVPTSRYSSSVDPLTLGRTRDLVRGNVIPFKPCRQLRGTALYLREFSANGMPAVESDTRGRSANEVTPAGQNPRGVSASLTRFKVYCCRITPYHAADVR